MKKHWLHCFFYGFCCHQYTMNNIILCYMINWIQEKVNTAKVDYGIASMVAPENGLIQNRRSWKQNSELVRCGVCHVFKVLLLTCIILLFLHFGLLNNAQQCIVVCPWQIDTTKKACHAPENGLVVNRRSWKENTEFLLCCFTCLWGVTHLHNI